MKNLSYICIYKYMYAPQNNILFGAIEYVCVLACKIGKCYKLTNKNHHAYYIYTIILNAAHNITITFRQNKKNISIFFQQIEHTIYIKSINLQTNCYFLCATWLTIENESIYNEEKRKLYFLSIQVKKKRKPLENIYFPANTTQVSPHNIAFTTDIIKTGCCSTMLCT